MVLLEVRSRGGSDLHWLVVLFLGERPGPTGGRSLVQQPEILAPEYDGREFITGEELPPRHSVLILKYCTTHSLHTHYTLSVPHYKVNSLSSSNNSTPDQQIIIQNGRVRVIDSHNTNNHNHNNNNNNHHHHNNNNPALEVSALRSSAQRLLSFLQVGGVTRGRSYSDSGGLGGLLRLTGCPVWSPPAGVGSGVRVGDRDGVESRVPAAGDASVCVCWRGGAAATGGRSLGLRPLFLPGAAPFRTSPLSPSLSGALLLALEATWLGAAARNQFWGDEAQSGVFILFIDVQRSRFVR
ncbi:hypothetical protein EYF80_043604 [Liparis tanakae]|uniref:Uncharacterized protein n=1 Tax=Liparis tanakae TaxID=230148 RepID=A0A4Z2FZE6_9TELE|nr:hypothetical protein EYF80_043604 [Liparis tanakae]